MQKFRQNDFTFSFLPRVKTRGYQHLTPLGSLPFPCKLPIGKLKSGFWFVIDKAECPYTFIKACAKLQ